ncbi:MAG: SpoIIE family protein phosphatase [Spirochaetia bacterium]|nr:SpoIIE family protein phosphatase [Spirochaetia bacterium]
MKVSGVGLIEFRSENIRLKRLLDTASSLNSSLDIEHLLPLIIISARDLLEAEASSLFLLDKKHDYLFCEVAIGEKGKLLKRYLRLEIGEGIAGWVAKNKKAILLKDAYQDPRFDQSWDKISGFVTRSIICIPIYIKEQFIGTLEVMNKRNLDSFDETDLETLEYLGNIAAIALENARLHDGLQIKIRELSLLTKVEKKISSGWNADQIIDWTLAKAVEILQARGGSALLISEDRKYLKVKCSVGFIKAQIAESLISMEKGIIGIATREKRPVLIKNLHADTRLRGEPIQSHESTSMLCAPLISQGELYGVLIVNDKMDGFSFTRDDLESLNNVSERISILLRTAHLFDKVSEQNREQESAGKLIEKILPTSIPVVKGLELYTRYIPYNLIGGDFYRFFEFSENKLGILIVDVSGHGFSAALISVMVNTMISAIPVDITDSPALFFNHLNHNLVNRLDGNFLTGIYLVIDMDKRSVRFANAGHPGLIHYQKNSKKLISENVRGPLLGVWEDPLLDEKEFSISPGDRLIIYTDGLLEFDQGKNYPDMDEPEMFKDVLQYVEQPAIEFLDQIVQAMLKRSSKNEFNDDVTVIVVDINNK